MTLHAKISKFDLQRYSWNLDLIKHVEDTVVFLTRKVFNYHNFPVASYICKKCTSQYCRETAKETKTYISNLYTDRSDKPFKGTSRCKLCIAVHSCIWRSLETKVPVPVTSSHPKIVALKQKSIRMLPNTS